MIGRDDTSPYYPYISVTTIVGCRVACAYCPQSAFTRAYTAPGTEYRTMSFTDLTRYLGTVPCAVGIHFGGFSEAWLNPDCNRMLLYSHEKGHRITVHTTLVGMTPTTVSQIAQVPFRLFRVHLPDGRMRLSVDRTYLDTLSALRHLRIRNVEYVRLVSDAGDLGDMDERVHAAVGKGPLYTDRLSDRAGNIEGLGIERTERKVGRIRCSFDPTTTRLDHNILLPNGDLVLCCSDWSLTCVVGSLARTSYQDIIEHSPVLAAIRRGLDDDSQDILCRRCALAVRACSD
jgi:hypothetical protein